ncbi:hypothetical protein [Paractinoplanes durhamensis]|uniref:hypothetical protein n=1 Tax=Paractinoplanes durhamensis TaxID=113563 RepID=UPI003644E618
MTAISNNTFPAAHADRRVEAMRRIVVTGAASGIGAAVTSALRAQGDEVVPLDSSAEAPLTYAMSSPGPTWRCRCPAPRFTAWSTAPAPRGGPAWAR